MVVKDNGKCRGLTAFVKEVLEDGRSPCQDRLLVVQWKITQIPQHDCQVDSGVIPCKWELQGGGKIYVIWCLRIAPFTLWLSDELTRLAGSANTCRAIPSPWRDWAPHCHFYTFEERLSYLSDFCPTADEAALCSVFLFAGTSNLMSHFVILQTRMKYYGIGNSHNFSYKVNMQ